MDFIGKAYLDYFIKIDNLDGQTHSLNCFDVGGVSNLLKDWDFDSLFEEKVPLNFFIFCDPFFSDQVKKIVNNNKVKVIDLPNACPRALIIEENNKRTSFVLDDEILEIKKFNSSSPSACIFYGDKINSNIFQKYEKLFIDTAGNDLEHLMKLSLKTNFPSETILSISNEYLNKELIENIVKNEKFFLLAHSPMETIIYDKKTKLKIKNKYFIKDLNKDKKITGLGDKFIFLISIYNYHMNLSLEDSILKAQHKLYLHLV